MRCSHVFRAESPRNRISSLSGMDVNAVQNFIGIAVRLQHRPNQSIEVRGKNRNQGTHALIWILFKGLKDFSVVHACWCIKAPKGLRACPHLSFELKAGNKDPFRLVF